MSQAAENQEEAVSFQLVPIEGDKWKLVFTNESEYVHSLKMAPESREADLNTGTWLIVTFSVWSGLVLYSVTAAVNCARAFGGRFQLGVRPFDYYEEIYKWCPSYESPSRAELSSDPDACPIWLVLKDGQIMHSGSGLRSKDQLKELLIRYL